MYGSPHNQSNVGAVTSVCTFPMMCCYYLSPQSKTVHVENRSCCDEVTINGSKYTKLSCYTRALEMCPTYAFAWNRLGVALTAGSKVTVGGTEYDKQACLGKAASLGYKP